MYFYDFNLLIKKYYFNIFLIKKQIIINYQTQ